MNRFLGCAVFALARLGFLAAMICPPKNVEPLRPSISISGAITVSGVCDADAAYKIAKTHIRLSEDRQEQRLGRCETYGEYIRNQRVSAMTNKKWTAFPHDAAAF